MTGRPNAALKQAVENLFFDCAGCSPGDRILIVHENENDGYYDPELVHAVSQACLEIDLEAKTYAVPFQRHVSDPDADLVRSMDAVDCTVFFARIGDQVRFRASSTQKTQVISYALDQGMLSSAFGRTPYSGFQRLKQLVDAAVFSAGVVHVTCPNGTDFKGTVRDPLTADADVTCKRFPLSVFTPVPARAFQGTIAQRGFLTGTGSHFYEPYSCALHETLFVSFDGNQITNFDGQPKDVAAARAHYQFVGNHLGIDTHFVHSWHVGIHPGCSYLQPAGASLERWSGGAFGNPRLLHFHTCGAYRPGEISLNILDPTVRLDGVAVWDNGRLYPERLPGGDALLAEMPQMNALFDAPGRAVGQAADGQLSFG